MAAFAKALSPFCLCAPLSASCSPWLLILLQRAAPCMAAPRHLEHSHRHLHKQRQRAAAGTSRALPTSLNQTHTPVVFATSSSAEAGRLQHRAEQLWSSPGAVVQHQLSAPPSPAAFPPGLKKTRSKFFPSFEASPRLLFWS